MRQTSKTGPSPKHPGVMVRRELPFNAETPLELLRRDCVTPRELFYVRNHGALPAVDPATYHLTVDGLVERPLKLSLEQLENEFSRVEIVSTLYCAGNRRRELAEVRAMPGKVPWEAGAAGNARWAGAPLHEVLRSAGVREKARHAAFTRLDEDEESGTGTHFGGSVPIEKATSDGVILAYEMNGEPLAPEHGFPLRVVVGGYIGARNVKWLSGISLQQAPSNNHYQAREYKLFPPDVTEKTVEEVWNFLGYANNAWHRVNVRAEG